MSLGKIYTYPNNWRVKRAQAVAAWTGASVEEVHLSLPEFREQHGSKFALTCVPAFEGTDGTCIQESAVIATHVAIITKSGLIPSESKAAAEVAQWSAFADQEIATPLSYATGMIAGYVPYNKPIFTYVIDTLMGRLATLEKHLQTRTFVVGERITLADILLASSILGAFTTQIDASLRSKVPNVVRYAETVLNNPKIASAFGDIAFVDTAKAYTAPKKEAPAKAAAPAAAAAPKAPKAPKPKAPAADDDEEDDLVPQEVKAKNPLDDLPKSEFKLDDWKRSYSNEETKDAIAWFYKNFDAEGYSVWKVDYKYNDELTQVFMSSNLIGGFFARLEASRKYLFGSAAVFGKANDSVISGVFVARGKDFKLAFDCAPDWESYSYTQLDLSKDEDKKFFEQLLEWSGEIEGKPFADGKIFK